MNEQLVQELAVQIDGQIAQSCGSHDPNVKSSYIIQKYPQVRSCANYSEAVLLLAREQAALQVPQMGYGHTPQPTFGQQHNSLGQLQSGFGRNNQQQSSGFGGSQAGGFGQPQAGGFGQPQAGGFGQPQAGGFGQPQAGGFGQPQAGGFGQLQPQQFGGFGQQDFGVPSQSFGTPPPPGVFGQPAIPQTGQVGASQFTVFQPPKESKPKSDKILGFIPPKVFAVAVIAIVVSIVIGGIAVSIKNAVRPKQPKPNAPIEQTVPQSENSIDSLFD